MAMMALARHIGREPIMISNLVGYSIEDLTSDLVAPYVVDMKAPYEQAVTTFEWLPAGGTLKTTLVTEKRHFAEWIVKKLRESEKTGNWRELWKGMIDGSGEANALQFNSAQEVISRIEELFPVYVHLSEMVELPPQQFDERYPLFRDKAKADNPLAGLLLPAIDKVLAKERRTKARMAMLMASIAVAEGGPEKLKEIRDPFGDGPFEYRKLEQGFELTSKLRVEDQPVQLTVGQRKRK
jgi:hypothetical protein